MSGALDINETYELEFVYSLCGCDAIDINSNPYYEADGTEADGTVLLIFLGKLVPEANWFQEQRSNLAGRLGHLRKSSTRYYFPHIDGAWNNPSQKR